MVDDTAQLYVGRHGCKSLLKFLSTDGLTEVKEVFLILDSDLFLGDGFVHESCNTCKLQLVILSLERYRRSGLFLQFGNLRENGCLVCRLRQAQL